MRSEQKPESEILEDYTTDYNLIPTTVFSPTEYSFVGLSEQEAIEKYGEDNIEVYLKETTSLQNAIYTENTKFNFFKVITHLKDKERVIGMHYVGPGAEEVIGGFAVAMKLGMTKKDLDRSIGVHPSNTEDFFLMKVTKRSGQDYRKGGC